MTAKPSIAVTLARLAQALHDYRNREARKSLEKVESIAEVLSKVQKARDK